MHPYSRHSCHDCAAPIGNLHHLGCDEELCPHCGWQLISCWPWFGNYEEGDPEPENYVTGCTSERVTDADRLLVPELWPGEAECYEFGWYSKYVTGQGHIRCDKDDPDAGPDLNRLYGGECVWSRERRRWVLR